MATVNLENNQNRQCEACEEKATMPIASLEFSRLPERNSLVVPASETISCSKALGTSLTTGYGFDLKYNGVFSDYSPDSLGDLFELSFQPEKVSMLERNRQRLRLEKKNFSIDYYLFDYVDEDFAIEELLKRQFWFSPLETKEDQLSQSISNCCLDTAGRFLSAGGLGQLSSSTKETPLPIQNESSVLVGLIEILLCYCYAYRLVDGDLEGESSWNLSILSPTFSHLDQCNDLNDLWESFLFRSLAYPLIRSWKYSLQVAAEVCQILRMGKEAVLRALLQVKRCFDSCEIRKVFVEIFINDYCCWVSSDAVSDTALSNLLFSFSSLTKSFEKQNFTRLDLLSIENSLLVAE